jgi:hypothetical protein
MLSFLPGVARTPFSNRNEGVQTNAPSVVQVFEQTPCPALRPFIQRFLVVKFPSLHRDAHLPDTRPVAAFSLRGRCRIDVDRWAPPAAFTGLRETLRIHEHCHHHAVLLATFTPVGATGFLRASLEEFSGTTTDLAGILGRPEELDRLHEQLSETQNPGRRIKLLENFLLARVRVSAPDPLVAAAVAWLEQGTGTKRIDDLTRYIGLSQSALERRFRRGRRSVPQEVRLRGAAKARCATAGHRRRFCCGGVRRELLRPLSLIQRPNDNVGLAGGSPETVLRGNRRAFTDGLGMNV